MGRKPKKGLREAILAAASEQTSSAKMLQDALETKYGAQPTSLTGVIKAAESLRSAGMLQASQAMPRAFRGARTRTYYSTTPQGMASLKSAIASATDGWNGLPATPAAAAAERPMDAPKTKKRGKTV